MKIIAVLLFALTSLAEESKPPTTTDAEKNKVLKLRNQTLAIQLEITQRLQQANRNIEATNAEADKLVAVIQKRCEESGFKMSAELDCEKKEEQKVENAKKEPAKE